MNHPADARYFAQVDADARTEQAIESIADNLLENLLTVGGHADIDDESVQLNLNVESLRKAYALKQAGALDAALTAFADAFRDACAKTADEEAPGLVSQREAEAAECAAEARWDARREG